MLFSAGYVQVVLALAPFLVCLAFSLDRSLWNDHVRRLAPLCAACFFASVLIPECSVWGCLPWLLLCVILGAGRLLAFLKAPRWKVGRLSKLAGYLYLPVGGVWALFDQLGYQPLGFSAIIVLLTGVHFHYAGFALPQLTGYWLEALEGGETHVDRAAGAGVVVGVPLVAIGITSSQLALPFWVETVSVTILASSAFVVSLGHLRWAGRGSGLTRWLFALAGTALAGGMILAMLYGWREVMPLPWITIPAMYAVHGTLNSWGFCLPGFVAWKLLSRA